MPSSMNRLAFGKGGGMPVMPTPGGIGKQMPTAPSPVPGSELIRLSEMMNEFRNWQRDRPFRPAAQRVPATRVRDLERLALEHASRMARRNIPIALFRRLLEWLFTWLMRQELEPKRESGGWRIHVSCPMPGPSAGPPTFTSAYLGGPPYGNYIVFAKNCLSGQGGGAFSSLQDVEAGAPLADTSVQLLTYQLGPVRGTWEHVWTKPANYARPAPWTWPDIDWWPEDKRLPDPPPPALEPWIPDWQRAIDPSRPPNPRTPEAPDRTPANRREPSTIIDINAGPRTITATKRKRIINRKPTRPGEKEKKFQGTGNAIRLLFTTLSRIKESATELDDFLDTFVDALPKEVKDKMPKRNGRSTPDLKAKHIYDNWDKIDWAKWAQNVVENWIEDKLVGAAIAASDKASKLRGDLSTLKGRGTWLHNAIGGWRPPR